MKKKYELSLTALEPFMIIKSYLVIKSPSKTFYYGVIPGSVI